MKSPKYFSLGTIAVLALLVSIGAVMADPMVTQTPEIQGFTSTTSMNVVGLATENDAIAWQDSNGAVTTSNLNIPSGFIDFDPYIAYLPAWGALTGNRPGQVLYTVAYDDTTTALNGAVTYNKDMSINTGNKVASQSNVKADKIVTFEGVEAGTMTSSENLLVDGAGQFDWTSSKMLCPFAGTTSTLIPPFCNIAQTGSSVDLTSGRLVTSSHERTVAATSDPGVEAGHDISVTGIGGGVALGSADAYLKVHVQEGGRIVLVQDLILAKVYTKPTKTEDLQYSEFSSASPTIMKFSKSMDYKSGLNTL